MRDRKLRLTSYVLAVVGLACAVYLTYGKVVDGGQCVASGCSVLQQSRWSELMGLPVAAFGVVGYVLTLLLLSLRGESARLLVVGVTGVGFLFSMYMMYRAYITLHAFCPFCTASAVMMTLLFAISAARFVLGPDRPQASGPGSAAVAA